MTSEITLNKLQGFKHDQARLSYNVKNCVPKK